MHKGYKPQLNRQNTKTAIKERQSYGISCGLIILLPVAIACEIIASEYDDISDISPCKEPRIEGEKYIVDLQNFLYIAGGVLLIHFIIHFCIGMFGVALFGDDGKIALEKFLSIGAIGFELFYLLWASIGIYIWSNQMNVQCQKEDIGIMIISWSCIQFGLLAIACCISFGILICVTMCLTNASKKVDDDEQEEEEHK